MTTKPKRLRRTALALANITALFFLPCHPAGNAHAQWQWPNGRQTLNYPESTVTIGGWGTRMRPANIRDTFPFRAVAKLLVFFPKGRPVDGTGVFVSAGSVFTAAHVVYDPKRGGRALRVVIAPGYDNGHAPFGVTEAVRVEVPDEYLRSEDSNYDFAAIQTASPLGHTSGWLGFGIPTTRDMERITIAGYPVDIGEGHLMVYSSSDARLVNGNELGYKANTFQGMSGAPIINSKNQVVGVHTRGDANLQFNFGTRFMDLFIRKFR